MLVFEASAEELRTAQKRALARGLRVAIYTKELFATGPDDENRAAVRVVATGQLDLVGLGMPAPHRDADAVLRR